jgi:uncharacterized membrane protein
MTMIIDIVVCTLVMICILGIMVAMVRYANKQHKLRAEALLRENEAKYVLREHPEEQARRMRENGEIPRGYNLVPVAQVQVSPRGQV